MQDVLFVLLRNELWQEVQIDITLSEEEKERLFANAKKQAVIGLVANALIRNNVSIGRVWVIKALTLTKQIEDTNKRINGELVRFANFMFKNNVDYRVVKGQTVATLYLNPLLRCAGDIDFYCDASNFSLTQKLIEDKLGIEVESNSAKHIEFQVNRVQYEMHSKLTEFSYGKHQKYWERILEQEMREKRCMVRINNTEVPVLSPTMNVLYLFCHIFYHLIINGIGLRQFCDLTLFIDRHYEEIDWKLLDKHLKHLGIKRAFTATGYVIVELLGLRTEKFPYSLTDKDRKVGKRIVKSVIMDGDWARDRHHVKGKGVLHSMETGYISLVQSMKYVDVAPLECLLRMPRLGMFFLEKLR